METTIKLKMVDTCNIQLGNHFNNIVNDYSTIAKAISPDKTIDKKSELYFEYVEGLQRKYYGLVEALANNGILRDNIKVVDLGCGLCTTLYNIMGQFKGYGLSANFYGIEHNDELLKSFNKYLSPLWEDNIPYFSVGDIMECELSYYDLILTFQPFKKLDDINSMYDRVFEKMKVGSIFHEHMVNGAKVVHNLEECKQALFNSANKNNMEQRVLLFGGQKQILFIKK